MKALIDAEFYLYRAAAGSEYEAEWGPDDWTYVCRHGDARASFQEVINEFLEVVPDHQPVMVFGDSASFRYSVWPKYKGNRKKYRKPAGYSALKEWVVQAADARGWQVATLPAVEGDDVLGLLAEEGDVIISGDKDMLTLPGLHLRNGEILEQSRLDADRAFYAQVLIGDASDNYPGCPGYGPVAAERALAGAANEDEMWDEVLRAYLKKALTERYAITQARCARILRPGEYDHDRGVPILWKPPVA